MLTLRLTDQSNNSAGLFNLCVSDSSSVVLSATPVYFLASTNHNARRGYVMEGASNQRMRRTNQRSQAKMAAGSDLLGDVFFNRKVDIKVVSELLRFLDSERSEASDSYLTSGLYSAENHVDSSCN